MLLGAFRGGNPLERIVAYARKCQLVSTPEIPGSGTCAAAGLPEYRDGPEADFEGNVVLPSSPSGREQRVAPCSRPVQIIGRLWNVDAGRVIAALPFLSPLKNEQSTDEETLAAVPPVACSQLRAGYSFVWVHHGAHF
jgi:hypothetical protein